jgi:hypothetical protein
MRNTKKKLACLVLAFALIGGISFATEAATSYSMKSGKSVTVTNKNTDGKGKKYYFTFQVKKRSKVTVSVRQTYKDDDVAGLKAKDIADTGYTLQVKKNGKWKNVRKTEYYAADLGNLEIEDGEDQFEADGAGSREVCLEKGTYRYVIQSGYPEMKVTLKIKKFSKPALKKSKAKKVTNTADGIFTSKDTKAQWYRFTVSKKGKIRVGVDYEGNSENKTILTLYLYNKSGKLLWKGNGGITKAMTKSNSGYFTGGPDKWLTLSKGTYYVKVAPTSVNKEGASYTFYTYPEE